MRVGPASLRLARAATARRAPRPPAASRQGLASRPWWPWARRIATLAFFALVGGLLLTQARTVQWAEVLSSVRALPAANLLVAGALAVASHALYSCFDLLGRHGTGHRLARRTVMGITFVSYAFNLNLGSLVGGVAFRYRLYARLGLDNAVITRVLSMSMLTNWLGYLLLAGTVFMLWPLTPPPDWKLDGRALQGLGALLFAVAIGYVALCTFSRRRGWTLRGHRLELPSGHFALLQLAISSANWLLMVTLVFVLLQQRIDFQTVLGVLLVAAVAGVITHVPAGLGVLEAVFVALLSHALPTSELLGALLAYRALYYLGPLAVATLAYLAMELKARRLGAKR
ncbi:lysylphosphatidylglycerol synthase domain-containing protein [Methylibium sp.]|uniref:lysylphosphatidylglycerol synthase domain-containing protein n=1 Tax=Methylibium sp. TaxID=2067992 RepID=UPI003D0AB1CB